MRISLFLGLLSLSSVATAQSLTMAGDCPGPVTIDVAGLTPGGTAVFLAGMAGEGSDVIGVGACTGTVTGLAGMRFLTRTVDGDGDGSLSFYPSIPDSRCDTPIQVLDTTTCTLSEVTTANSGGGDITMWSQGTEEWPDQACNSINSFGSCDSNDEIYATAWATWVCQQNGYSYGEWTGEKIAGCAGEYSMYCSYDIPCIPRWEFVCSEGDQTQIEFTCYL